MDQPPSEGSYKSLEEKINKLSEDQTSIVVHFDFLSKNIEELRKVSAELSDKTAGLESLSTDRKKLQAEVKVLKYRIDELYGIVKEGKEDDSCHSDVQDIQSCHSGFSSSSKVKVVMGPIL